MKHQVHRSISFRRRFAVCGGILLLLMVLSPTISVASATEPITLKDVLSITPFTAKDLSTVRQGGTATGTVAGKSQKTRWDRFVD